MKRFISITLLSLLGFAMKIISMPRQLFVDKNEMLEIDRRLDAIGNL